MKICFERENYYAVTGRTGHNHCGNHITINGIDYCPTDGKIKGYGCNCADICRLDRSEQPKTKE